MTKSLFEEYVADPVHMRLFQQERAILEATELLEVKMAEMGVTRAELAKRLGKSKGWVTQLLDGEANKTIRTVADAFAVLELEYHSSCSRIEISNAGSTQGIAARTVSVNERDAPVAVPFATQTTAVASAPLRLSVCRGVCAIAS